MMRRPGFTIFELLVVFAIIAIISGIVLPVLWQAHAGVTASICMSNQRQIGSAHTMYVQDYDGVLPSIYTIATAQSITIFDIPVLIASYARDTRLFYCPDYAETGCVKRGAVTLAGLHDIGTLSMASQPGDPCMGYGYNFGPSATAGGGLLATPRSVPGRFIYAGIPMSAVASPTKTFVSGETYSLVSYSVDSEDILERYAGAKRNSALRHRGHLTMLFLDAHAKSMAWRGTEGGYGFPANSADYADWCADPSAIIGATNGLSCEQFTKRLANLQTWWPD